MRIAFLCTSGLDYPSPRGRWLPVAEQLVYAGHQPTLLMLHPTWDRIRQPETSQYGVRMRYVGQMHVYGYPGARRALRPAELLAIALRSALALTAEAIRMRAEIIQIAKPQPINGLAGLLAARILGVPIVIDSDDYEAGANRFAARWQQRMVTYWETYLPRLASGVTVNTRFMQQFYEKATVPQNRLHYVPNGIRPSQLAPPSMQHVQALRAALGLTASPVLAYIGAMSRVAHGVGLLLEAFAITLRQLPHARLLLVGSGDDLPDLRRQASQLGIDQATIWVGHVAPSATRAYMALATASCDPVADTPAMAARSPLKIVESIAQGIPVITGDVGDRRTTLADRAGLIVAPGDASALAIGITSILSNTAMRQRMAAAAREQAELFRWEHLATPWIEMINQAAR
jgi:glycosyltransferase involved in cell wall biosynthesis